MLKMRTMAMTLKKRKTLNLLLLLLQSYLQVDHRE